MDEEYSIVFVEKPEQSAWGIIGRSLGEYNAQHAGDEHAQRLCYVVQSPTQEILGGVVAVIYWDWLYVDLMWLKEEVRGRGYGRRLLALVEEEAQRRGAKNVHLDTFSFQAPEFYLKQGYRIFGQLENFPAGHTRYFLTKQLAA